MLDVCQFESNIAWIKFSELKVYFKTHLVFLFKRKMYSCVKYGNYSAIVYKNVFTL